MYPNRLCQLLQIEQPIIKAPMAGGADRPELVAAVSEAGGIGFTGAAYQSADQIEADCARIRQLTDKPFGINLFVPEPKQAPPADPQPALDALAPWFEELGLPTPALTVSAGLDFDHQLEAALESGARALSFTFGLLPPQAVAAARARGMLLIGNASTVAEARALEESGVDAIVAQGSEAGGHRASFAGSESSSGEVPLIGTLALVPQVVDAVRLPVIAAGGIMDGRGITAALALGADAAQLGTAFLSCREAGIPDVYKQAILDADEADTAITRAFSGRSARGIRNRVMERLNATPEAILPFPYQNELTRPMRGAAAKAGEAQYLSLWAGQGLRMSRALAAAQLMDKLVEESAVALAWLKQLQ
ncbi:NAD(P)H-dependent flavin oxidoreductase [Marinobacterium arenosum]|uniref:NAD(P)H-dependent flavin oxidoreductase n=1 Tax=Marinobacterium arenosum TaxID=2862496 RepID=UPI001C95741F|nr:nitronate monooxygenase [Marinobacterium arenosum]MBY4676981.1 nitronate monooxygenase [Marinobacterium arenosum]